MKVRQIWCLHTHMAVVVKTVLGSHFGAGTFLLVAGNQTNMAMGQNPNRAPSEHPIQSPLN